MCAVQCGSLHRIMRLGRTGGDSSSFEHVKMSIVSALFTTTIAIAPHLCAYTHACTQPKARTHAPRRAEMAHCSGTESGGRATPAATERQRLCRSCGNSEVRRVRTRSRSRHGTGDTRAAGRTSKRHTHLKVLSLVGEARLHLSARTVALHDRNLRSIGLGLGVCAAARMAKLTSKRRCSPTESGGGRIYI